MARTTARKAGLLDLGALLLGLTLASATEERGRVYRIAEPASA